MQSGNNSDKEVNALRTCFEEFATWKKHLLFLFSFKGEETCQATTLEIFRGFQIDHLLFCVEKLLLAKAGVL